jgi:hypothetical protein
MSEDDSIAKLARRIAAARKTEHFQMSPDSVAALRRRGACELHSLCANFVISVNTRLAPDVLDLSPLQYAPEMFRETGVNLIQIGSHGRQMQISFEAPAQLSSTEKFLIPYVLEGEIRAFNQKMLEKFQMRTRLLFFCIEEDRAAWRYYDWRTRHTGLLGPELFVTLMQQLF